MNKGVMCDRLKDRLYCVGPSILLLIVMTACSRPTLPTWLGGQAATPIPTPIAIHAQLRLWNWHGTAVEDAHLQTIVDNFEETHPTIAVELFWPDNYMRRLRTALGNESPPDVFLLNMVHLPDMVAEGVLMSFPATFTAESDLYPHLRRAMQIDSTPYCAPKSFYTLALFYNRTRFDEAELPYPDRTWGWDELQATATELTDLQANIYGLVLPADVSRWAAFLTQAGGSIITPDGSAMAINSPAAQEALAYYTTLVLEGMAAPPTTLNSRWPGEAFAQGRVAMMIEGNWAVPYLAENAPTLAYGITGLPTGPAERATVSFATCFAMAAETAGPNQAAAKELIAYLTAADTQQSWFAINQAIAARPSLEAQWRTVYPTLQPFIDDTNGAIEWQLPTGFQPWVEEMNDGLRQIFGGFIPTSTLLPEAEARGNEHLGASDE